MIRLWVVLVAISSGCAGTSPESKLPSSRCTDLVHTTQQTLVRLGKERGVESLGQEVSAELGLLDMPSSDCEPPSPTRSVKTIWLVGHYEWNMCTTMQPEAVRTIRDVAAAGNTLALYHGSLALADVGALSAACYESQHPKINREDPAPFLAAIRARTQLAMGVIPDRSLGREFFGWWHRSELGWDGRLIEETRTFWRKVSRDPFVSAADQWPLARACATVRKLAAGMVDQQFNEGNDVADFADSTSCASVESALHVPPSPELAVLAERTRDIRARFIALTRLGDDLLAEGEVERANSMYAKAIEPSRDRFARQLLERHSLFEPVRNRVGIAAGPPRVNGSAQ